MQNDHVYVIILPKPTHHELLLINRLQRWPNPPENTKHFYNIFTMLDLRRWANVVQML